MARVERREHADEGCLSGAVWRRPGPHGCQLMGHLLPRLRAASALPDCCAPFEWPQESAESEGERREATCLLIRPPALQGLCPWLGGTIFACNQGGSRGRPSDMRVQLQGGVTRKASSAGAAGAGCRRMRALSFC